MPKLSFDTKIRLAFSVVMMAFFTFLGATLAAYHAPYGWAKGVGLGILYVGAIWVSRPKPGQGAPRGGQSGFTLIEMLLVLFILFVVLLVVLALVGAAIYYFTHHR